MVSWKSVGALALGIFVIVELIIFILSLIPGPLTYYLASFFFGEVEGGVLPTIWFWLFLTLGIVFLIMGEFIGYMKWTFSYVFGIIAGILLGLLFMASIYTAFIWSFWI